MIQITTLLRPTLLAAVGLVALVGLVQPAAAATIIDDWATIKAPPPPELKPVTINPKTTALLVMDFVKQNCNTQSRPRCVDSLPIVQKMLTEARAKGVTVIYTIIKGSTAADIAPQLKPLGSEALLTAGPDKFLGTDLEKRLKDKGIATVIVTGTSAQGAVLNTASAAALDGFKVVLPVDGMSASNPYAEQYVAWDLVNAPFGGVTVTKASLINY